MFSALGVVIALEGVGSALYHGTSGAFAEVLHDAPLLGTLGFLAGWHVARLGHHHAELVGVVGGMIAGAAASATEVTDVVAVLLVVTLVAAELLARQRHLRPIWNPPLVVLVAIAGATWLAGTSRSPLCDEQSLLQPHGAWHVLSALVVLAWAGRAAPSPVPH